MVENEAKSKFLLKAALDQKLAVIKRELGYLADGQSLKGWSKKMNGFLDIISSMTKASSAKEVRDLNMAFVHRAEVMEAYERPPKKISNDEDWLEKQHTLNESELTYFRNKNSQKLKEV